MIRNSEFLSLSLSLGDSAEALRFHSRCIHATFDAEPPFQLRQRTIQTYTVYMNTFPLPVGRVVRSTVNLPEPGRTAWISRLPQRPLPEGLRNRSRVQILAIGPRVCAVKTQDLKEWIVERVHIDAGARYDLHGNGSRAPEDHPAVQTYLLEEIEHLRAQPHAVPQIDDHRIVQICDLIWKLTRHGCQVPPATDPDQREKEDRYTADVLGYYGAPEIISVGHFNSCPAIEDDSPP